jgi:hypothetical protein
MWLYYAALQITMLVTQHGSMQLPACVAIILNTITDIINLSSFNKQRIEEWLHIDSAKLTQGGLLQNLDGVAFSFILISVFVLVLFISLYFARNKPFVRKILLLITKALFWNFIIRYFQASFISFNYAALTSVYHLNTGALDIGSSFAILTSQYLVIVCVLCILVKKPLYSLDAAYMRLKIGNLY